jgi:hypothetical protein
MNLSSTDIREIRKFGTIAFLFFACLAALGLWRQMLWPVFAFGFLSLTGIALLLFPYPLSPVYFIWLKITRFIGLILTMFILTLAYYLVITPTALLKRLAGGRPISLEPDRNVSSYWITRSEPFQAKERFHKRY